MLNISSPLFKGSWKVFAAVLTLAIALQASAPPGWVLAGNKRMDYTTGTDDAASYNNHPSAFLKAKDSSAAGFGTLMQEVSASKYLGKRVRLSVITKTEDVQDWAGIWMRVDKETKVLAFDNMEDRPLTGNSGWQNREVVLDVAPDATRVAFGVLLSGAGTVWLNSVKIEVVGPEVPVTGMYSFRHHAEPQNLTFDQK